MFVQQTGSNIQEEALNCYIFFFKSTIQSPQFRKTNCRRHSYFLMTLAAHFKRIPLFYNSLRLIPFKNSNNLKEERNIFDLQFQLLFSAFAQCRVAECGCCCTTCQAFQLSGEKTLCDFEKCYYLDHDTTTLSSPAISPGQIFQRNIFGQQIFCTNYRPVVRLRSKQNIFTISLEKNINRTLLSLLDANHMHC